MSKHPQMNWDSWVKAISFIQGDLRSWTGCQKVQTVTQNQVVWRTGALSRLSLVFPERSYLFDNVRCQICVQTLIPYRTSIRSPDCFYTQLDKRAQTSNCKPSKSTPLHSALVQLFRAFLLVFLSTIPAAHPWVNAPLCIVYPFSSIPPAFTSGLLVFITRVRWHHTDASQAS